MNKFVVTVADEDLASWVRNRARRNGVPPEEMVVTCLGECRKVVAEAGQVARVFEEVLGAARSVGAAESTAQLAGRMSGVLAVFHYGHGKPMALADLFKEIYNRR
jgi:hypothetical protein